MPTQIEPNDDNRIETNKKTNKIKGNYEKKSTQERNVFSSFVKIKLKLFFVRPLVYSLKKSIKQEK